MAVRLALAIAMSLTACSGDEPAQTAHASPVTVAASVAAGSGGSSAGAAGSGTAECAHASVQTAGECQIELPPEAWAGRLDCTAELRLGDIALPCGGPPNGWSITKIQTLTLYGTSCDLARADATERLEVLVPCEI